MAQLELDSFFQPIQRFDSLEAVHQCLVQLVDELRHRIDRMVFYYNDTVTVYNTTDNVRPTLPPINEIVAYDTATGGAYIASNGTWVPVGGGTMPVSTHTANVTLNGSHGMVICNTTSAAVTVTLPLAASYPGKIFHIFKANAAGNTLTIQRSGADTINGLTSHTPSAQYEDFLVQSDGGSLWYYYT